MTIWMWKNHQFHYRKMTEKWVIFPHLYWLTGRNVALICMTQVRRLESGSMFFTLLISAFVPTLLWPQSSGKHILWNLHIWIKQ